MAITEEEKKEIQETRTKRREAGVGFAREAGIRSEAAAKRMRDLIGEAEGLEETGVSALEQAADVGRGKLRQRAARGLAASQAAGAFGGGGTAASLRGTAAELGMGEAELESQAALGIEDFRQGAFGKRAGLEQAAGQAEVDAAVQALEGEKFAAEAGTELEDRQEKLRTYQEQIAKIKADASGVFRKDWKTVVNAIQGLLDAETDPALQEYLLREKRKVQKRKRKAL